MDVQFRAPRVGTKQARCERVVETDFTSIRANGFTRQLKMMACVGAPWKGAMFAGPVSPRLERALLVNGLSAALWGLTRSLSGREERVLLGRR